MSQLVQGIFLPASGDIEPLPIPVGDHEDINARIGGHFDCVRLDIDPRDLLEDDDDDLDGATPFTLIGFVHDEGRIINLPLNKCATMMFGQPLFGDVVVVSGTSPDGEDDGESYSIPAWFSEACHNGSLVEASKIIDSVSGISKALRICVQHEVATKEEIMEALQSASHGDEEAMEAIGLLVAYGSMIELISEKVSDETNWEVTDEEINKFLDTEAGD